MTSASKETQKDSTASKAAGLFIGN